MSYLFIVENNIAKPNTETLLISPFKEIWARDSSLDKSQAIKDFTFIEFMSSKKRTNPYAGYDNETRYEKLVENIYGGEFDLTKDKLIEEALVKIETFQKEASPTYTYYLAALSAADKMKKFFLDFDMDEVNERGQRVWKPKDLTSAMVDTEKILQNFTLMKEKVEQELFDSVRTKGNKQVNPFEM